MNTLKQLILAALIGMAAAANAQTAMSDGEIKKVDKEAGKLTIKHGELKNLDMPGMTMVFKVQAPAMLDQVKQGDKVRFAAEKVNGALTVTAIEVAQ
ncbi:copper-binding protein [Duganella sp.]|jgi:Cu/Ag efflux protein CusF|uniref:copper-binding protein n=1 Tax=Duganella sp. TaxID=1904440 RepID=UPI0031D91E4E